MLERLFEENSFGLHISNPNKVPGATFFDVSKMIVWLCTLYVCCLCIMAMYHGYVSWLCITAMYHGHVSCLCIMAMYLGYVSWPSWLCIGAMNHGYVYVSGL